MNQKKFFDLVVIGAGPGGYVAALKAASLKKKVALVEKNELGGVCLNVGCIPTKSLISHASFWEKVQKADKFGIKVNSPSFDFLKIKQKKDETVLSLRNSLKNLILKNKITIFKGMAKFLSSTEVEVSGEDNLILSSERIIIATGSLPQTGDFAIDHKQIFDSTSILDLEVMPKSITIIGGGYIGSEFASLYNQFGVKVTIIESKESILSGLEPSISETIQASFIKRGIEIFPLSKISKVEKHKNSVLTILESGEKIESEIVLLSIGRKCCLADLCLEKAGVKTANNAIEVDDYMQTSAKNIYAIGDVTGKWMLAHVASHEGILAAENAFGARKRMNFDLIPHVIFTSPEAASVGLTSKKAEERGYSIINAKFPLSALGAAKATLDSEGFVQIIADKKTKQVIGAHVVHSKASLLISEMALAITNELTLDCITDTIHPHPTISEAWTESAFIAQATPLNYF